MLAKGMTAGSKTKDNLVLTATTIAREPAFVLSGVHIGHAKKGQMIPAPVVGCITERNSGPGKPKSLYWTVQHASKSHGHHSNP